jgi:predicted RND superfamily exporter protein
MKKLNLLLILLLLAGITKVSAQADMQENVTMIKKNLSDSKAAMKKYEWIETTTVFVKGEQKSVKQKQCYYALDGKLTKVETGGSTAAKTPGGLRGRVAENKKADMSDYAKKAVEKVQTYLPPDPEKLQKIYNDGKAGIQILEPNKKFKLSFPDYNEAGDLLSVSLNKTDQKLNALDVSTSVDDPKQKVAFNVTFSDLPDGTQFQGTTTLDAPEKDLKIVIVNSGFKNASGK